MCVCVCVLCGLSVRVWLSEDRSPPPLLAQTGVVQTMRSFALARARVCVFVLVSLTLNPTLIYPLTLTTAAFQPLSTPELQAAVETCGADPMKE